MQRNVGVYQWLTLLAVCVILTFAVIASAETVSWTNPTEGVTDNGVIVPLSPSDLTALLGYIYYRIPPVSSWTQFATTTNGATSWTGTLPVNPGIPAEYNVSLGLVGQDNVLRKGPLSPNPYSYTVPFPPGPTPGAVSGVKVTKP